MLRHKNVFLCGVGAEARMLAARYDILASVGCAAQSASTLNTQTLNLKDCWAHHKGCVVG